MSGTTWVSQFQKGKTNLDLLEQETVIGSDISWAYAYLHLSQIDNHASIPFPSLSFLQAKCPSCRPTNSVKALLGKHIYTSASVEIHVKFRYCLHVRSIKGRSFSPPRHACRLGCSACVIFFFLWPIISGSIRPIFMNSFPNCGYFIVDYRFGPLFPIGQGTLPWQLILWQNQQNHSLLWHSKTDWNSQCW